MYIYIYYLQEDNEIELIIYEQGRIQDFFRGGGGGKKKHEIGKKIEKRSAGTYPGFFQGGGRIFFQGGHPSLQY